MAMPRGSLILSLRAQSRPSPAASRKELATTSTFPKRKKADALAARLRGEGFVVETRRGADETNWLVRVSHPSLEEDTIDRLEEQFTKYAEASGGEYDGYER